MVKIVCSSCPRELHQVPAFLLGPPDMVGKVRSHALCRTCFSRLVEMFRDLRARARNDGTQAATPHGGTPPGRQSIQAR